MYRANTREDSTEEFSQNTVEHKYIGITGEKLEISATVKGSNIQYPSTGERQYSKK